MTMKLQKLPKCYMCLIILCFLSSCFIMLSINSTQLLNNVEKLVEKAYTNNFLPKPSQILVEINDSTEHRTQSQNNPALLSNEDDGTRVQNVLISFYHSFED